MQINSYSLNTLCNLKTQNGFTQGVRERASRLGVDLFHPLENQIKLTNPFDSFKLNANLCLGREIVKRDTPVTVPHSLVMETMNTLYFEPTWLRIFTDISFLPDQPNDSAGVF
ncbi:hypothetical protein TNIN_312161 [Trichonephila inaurata madagascariensis]|uniref:Uncharacterized protein n=1 Tax=Trichonephila inaurata madagascariensis TaxID=2747483 RepID=A0A8X6II29_9ARAC|nr:hypothetical protein TNIN_312161 [Trichonephila inaurata madagascariensis]